MPLRYATGEEIQQGDKVLCDGLSGEIEFIADPQALGAAENWYVQEFGGGVMVSQLTEYGSLFLSLDHIDEQLVFVSRKA